MLACNNYIKTIFPDECVSESLATINSNFNALQSVTCELEQRFQKNKEVRTFFYYGPNANVDATSGMADNSTSRPSNETIQAFANSPELLNLPAISVNGDTAYVIYQKTGFKNSLSLNIPSDYKWSTPTTNTIITPNKTNNLTYNVWYNVSDYFSAIASSNGAVAGNRLGTINLEFRTPSGLSSKYSYTATGTGDDTYVEWNQADVILSEGYPFPKTARSTIPRPYKELPGVQFKFTRAGNPIEWFLTGTTKASTVVNGGNVTSDVVNEFSPVLIIWKLTCKDNLYNVDVGFPKFTRASTNNTNFTNWDNPASWARY
jgi:hypothetical protein